MIITIMFAALMAVSLGTAITLGGRDGRWIAVLYFSAALASYWARLVFPDWHHINWTVFAIDALLLAGLYAIALTSHRYWPIWIAGLHLLTVLSHVAAASVGTFDYRIYFGLESVWSLAKLTVLMLGILLDREARHDGGAPGKRARRARPSH